MKYCPKCRARTEKISGCNHITCPRCNFNWCWLCRSCHYDEHYNDFNLFGCPGGQFNAKGRCFLLFVNLIGLIFAPLILFFGATGAAIASMMSCWCREMDCRSTLSNCCCLIFFPGLVLPLGLAAGALCLGICILPVYIILILKFISIIFLNCKFNPVGCITCCSGG